MSIEFSTENKKNFLLLKTHGESTNTGDVIQFASDAFKRCLESEYSSILIDERDRKYNLTSVHDQDKMANYLSSLGIADLRIAFVCQEKYQEQVRFLEAAAQNRGLTIKFFIDLDSAEKWLTVISR